MAVLINGDIFWNYFFVQSIKAMHELHRQAKMYVHVQKG